MLDYTSADYLVRSSVLFRPVVAGVLIAVAAAAFVFAGGRGEWYSQKRKTVMRVFGTVAAVALVCVGLYLFTPIFTQSDGRALVAAWTLLAVGIGAVVLYCLHRSGGGGAQATVLVISTSLIVVAAFWLTTIYAGDEGRYEAQMVIAEQAKAREGHFVPPLPTAIVYGKEQLPLAGAQSTNEQPWRFAYTGYDVLGFGNHQWILVATDPECDWRPTAIVSDNDSVKVVTFHNIRPAMAISQASGPPSPAPSVFLYGPHPGPAPGPMPPTSGVPDVPVVPAFPADIQGVIDVLEESGATKVPGNTEAANGEVPGQVPGEYEVPGQAIVREPLGPGEVPEQVPGGLGVPGQSIVPEAPGPDEVPGARLGPNGPPGEIPGSIQMPAGAQPPWAGPTAPPRLGPPATAIAPGEAFPGGNSTVSACRRTH